MSLFTAQIFPGQALGFLVLGATLHDILTRLKAEPQRFPKLDLVYDQSAPVTEPVIVNLPPNGIRLRFDGPEQRLRLVEVLDFTKSQLTYKDTDVLRPGTGGQPSSVQVESLSGPTFRHIYNRLLGPTFPGEYVGPEPGAEQGMGLYVLSYPGIAFSFPLETSAWSPRKDFVSLLSSASSHPAASMAIFRGDSWPDARDSLYVQTLDPRDSFTSLMKGKDHVPDEVRFIRIFGEGCLELTRSEGVPPFWIKLGLTSPQELVAALGPPDAIYRKNDQRMSIHKARPTSRTHMRSEVTEMRLQDDSTDTDQSSALTSTDDSEDEISPGEVAGNVSGECFYNYFYHGFDILLSTPMIPSQCPPSRQASDRPPAGIIPSDASSRLVASKVILHGNVPGSYPFNRHRRCRWEIQYLLPTDGQLVIDSETPFKEIEQRLHDEWKSIYLNVEEAKSRQRGMVLNRDWGDSPGSSCELLGGWEDSVGGRRTDPAGMEDGKGLGNTTLFGFPGMVFEVLKNGVVSGLTVF
ncbi:related to UPF0183 domain protein [Rhynchosporium agropyri]|uniref:Related to UPF0183 domain protein n=1 Tax=Rhynchosporium agropyri TaxID=914238 RepID=A0A1E1KQM8_9HELO|nr:related to UPF0183 domain protein [Rhynchosporium agropyri]